MKKANFIKILMVFVLSCAIVFGCTAFFRPNLVTFAEQEPVVDPVLTWQSEENIEIATWYDELTYEDVTVFRISEAKQLSGLAKLVNSGVSFEGKIIKIQDTITLGKFIERETEEDPYVLEEGFEWTPIGTKENPFKGTFDGQNNVIKGIYINGTNDFVGLFGEIVGEVKNVNIGESYIKGSSNVGSIAGKLTGNADYCLSSATIVADANANKIGGLFGEVVGTEEVQSVVSNCSTTDSFCLTVNETAQVGDTYEIGGIIGFAKQNVLIENCYNRANIKASATYIGGVAGLAVENVIISRSYNDGQIDVINTTEKTEECVGGVVGCVATDSSVLGSYNQKDILTTANFVGGVVGRASGVKIDNCYNKAKVVGFKNVGGVIGSVESKSIVSDAHNEGQVLASSYNDGVCKNFGGVVGYNYDSEIKYCYNNGTVIYAEEEVVIENQEPPVEKPTILTKYVGGVIGKNIKGDISVVFNTGDVGDLNASHVAGIIAYNDNSKVVTSINTANVTGKDVIAGGIATNLNGSSIKNCLSNSTITYEQTEIVVGGLVGENDNTSFIYDCYFNTELLTDIQSIGKNLASEQNVKNAIGYNKSNMSKIKIELSDGSSCVGVIETFNQIAKTDTNSKWLADMDGLSNIVFGEENNLPMTITEILAVVLGGIAVLILVIYIAVYIKESRVKASIQEFDGYGKEDFEDMEDNM